VNSVQKTRKTARAVQGQIIDAFFENVVESEHLILQKKNIPLFTFGALSQNLHKLVHNLVYLAFLWFSVY